jgi:hypothetical protein
MRYNWPMARRASDRISYDQAIKQLLVDFPLPALALFAGEEGQLPPGVKVTHLKQEQVSRSIGKGFREIDSLLLLEFPDGSQEALVFLVEGEAHPTRDASFKLLEYVGLVARALEKQQWPTRIVPVIVVVAPGPMQTRIEVRSDRRTYLSFDCIVCRLADMVLLHRRLGPDQRSTKYVSYLERSARLNEQEQLKSGKALTKAEGGAMVSIFTEYIERGKAEGLAKGKAEGKAEGLAKGKADLILHLCEKRRLTLTAAQRRAGGQGGQGHFRHKVAPALSAPSPAAPLDEVSAARRPLLHDLEHARSGAARRRLLGDPVGDRAPLLAQACLTIESDLGRATLSKQRREMILQGVLEHRKPGNHRRRHV